MFKRVKVQYPKGKLYKVSEKNEQCDDIKMRVERGSGKGNHLKRVNYGTFKRLTITLN